MADACSSSPLPAGTLLYGSSPSSPLGATVAIKLIAPGVTDPAWIRAQMEMIRTLLPLAFVAFQTIHVVLTFVPGQTLAGVGGYPFGTFWVLYAV
jgi:uncharacterized membrane protein YdjX (TVP38/TMEM64 family)